MSDLRDVYLHDGDGNPIGSLGGALSIHDADVHRFIVNQHFHQYTATTTTFSVAATAGDTDINLADATGFAIGDHISLSGLNSEVVFPKITNLVGTVATLDRPIDHDYSIGDSITKTLISMDVVGTLASPQSFTLQPASGEIWHLTRILLEMTHVTAGDNGLFGGISALSNGVLLRRYDGATGTFSTFTNWKDNSDIVTDMYDVVYAARSGGGGAYGTNARGTFKNAGAIVYLDGTVGDYVEVLIQDDLSTLSSFRIKGQGHVEGF